MKPLFEAFELAAEYRQLAELLTERHDNPQLVEDTLESIAGPLDEHLENLAKMVRNLETASSGVEQTITSLEARQAGLQRAADRGRKMILELMQASGRERATTALFALAVKKNPPSIVVDSEADLPPAYLTYHEAPPPTPNKRAIAAAFRAGMKVPGAHADQHVRLEID